MLCTNPLPLLPPLGVNGYQLSKGSAVPINKATRLINAALSLRKLASDFASSLQICGEHSLYQIVRRSPQIGWVLYNTKKTGMMFLPDSELEGLQFVADVSLCVDKHMSITLTSECERRRDIHLRRVLGLEPYKIVMDDDGHRTVHFARESRISLFEATGRRSR
ncbi:hypothetical protein ACFOY8_14800 [Thalassospira xianhensis]|uniref:Uncharacterized protein n=1 Tax=Thalassospira xianhensis MCCC 1A02616 TaxID=1177929 RepID=A0A367UJS7_9PROT|nr:hypothetical protein [Thalassospira xianhensis]RCK07584.1 hypothetical protein TH5_00435 [Thalassospira xianhensis MCCC 1A02616]